MDLAFHIRYGLLALSLYYLIWLASNLSLENTLEVYYHWKIDCHNFHLLQLSGSFSNLLWMFAMSLELHV